MLKSPTPQFGIMPSSRTNKEIVYEEVEKNLNLITFAVYSMMLINDIASSAVTDCHSKLKTYPKVYSFNVKRKFRLLTSKRDQYVHTFNKLVGDDISQFCEWADNYNNLIIDHYDKLRFQYIQEMLRLDIPYPYLSAEILYMRDCIYLAIGNYTSWMKQIFETSPRLRGRLDFSSRSICDWEQAYINFCRAYCDKLGITDNQIEMKMDNIDLAKKVLFSRIADTDLIANALNIRKKNETNS